MAAAADAPAEAALQEALAHVSRLLGDTRAWANDRETIFELLRRSLLHCSRLGVLDTPAVKDSQIEDCLLFLIELRRTSPVRKRRIQECSRAVLACGSRWSSILHSPKIQEALRGLPGDAQSDFLHVHEEQEATEGHPDGHDVRDSSLSAHANLDGNPFKAATTTAGKNPFGAANGTASRNPFAAGDRDRNPFRATDAQQPFGSSPSQSPNSSKYANLSPTASSGTAVFSAALHTPQEHEEPGVATKIGHGISAAVSKTGEVNTKYGITDKVGKGVTSAATQVREFEQKHHVMARSADAARGAVTAASETNQKYGITDKIGQGVVTAAQKTRELEQKHHVTARAADAARGVFTSAKETNQKYHITDKIGQGVKTAAAKTVEFEQKHHVTSRVASGVSTGVGKAVSAANSLRQGNSAPAAGTNPFVHNVQQSTAIPAGRGQPSQNPFAQAQLDRPPATASSNPFRR